jgi:hypothetical protein
MKQIAFKDTTIDLKPITIGQLVDFQKMKAILSDGMYGAMFRMALKETDSALEAIDIQAFISSFVPDFAQKMKIPVKELGIKDFMELKTLYKEQLVPWYEEQTSMLNIKE